MSDDKAKLIYIALPFLVGSVILVVSYVLARLVVDIWLNIGHITQELWTYWIPLILAALFTAFVMHRRFMLLPIGEKWREFLYWAVGITLAVSMIGSQYYITSVSQTMHQVETLSAIGQPRPNDGYRISSGYKIESGKAGVFTERRSIPKRYGPSEVDLYTYLAIPLSESEEFSGPYTYWLVKEYKARVQNVSDSNIEWKRLMLYKKAEAELKSNRLRNVNHLLAAPLTERHRSMLAAIETSPASAVKKPVILTPQQSPMEKSNAGLRWALGSFAAALIIVVHFTFSAEKISEKKLKAFALRAKLPWKEKLNLQQLFSSYNSGQSSATWILLVLNILIFIVTVACGVSPISPSPLDLYEFGGATIRSVMNEGQWWRIFTSMFLHSGIFHLAMNVFVLVMVGFVVEPVMKRWKYVLIYFAAGVGAFLLASLFLLRNTVLVGASGAIFGIMGVLLSMYVKNSKKHRKHLTLFLWTGGISLLFGLLPGISNSAHIGGLITGFVLGLLFYQPPQKRQKEKSGKFI